MWRARSAKFVSLGAYDFTPLGYATEGECSLAELEARDGTTPAPGVKLSGWRKVRLFGGPHDGEIVDASPNLKGVHFTEVSGAQPVESTYRPSKKQSSDEMERWDWDGLASMDKIEAEPQTEPIRFREFT